MGVLRIKEVLKERGMTGAQLCKETGLSQTSLSRIIKGEQNPRLALLIQIAKVLDVDIKDLFNSTKDVDSNILYIKKNGKFVAVGKIKNS